MKNLCKVAVLVTGLFVSVFANAAKTTPNITKNLNTLEITTPADALAISNVVGKGSFTDTYNFTLTSGSTYSLSFDLDTKSASRFSTFGYQLYSTGPLGTSTAVLASSATGNSKNNLSVNNIGFGSYSLVVKGTGTEDDSSYKMGPTSIMMTSKITTPVPEPETYAMLLAGLGLLGAAVRRKKSQ